MLQVQEKKRVVLSDIDTLEVRKMRVVDKVRDLSEKFTIRQVAQIHQMSLPYLANLAETYDITFLDIGGSRSKRISTELVARERSHVRALSERSIVQRKTVRTLDSKKINPVLAELARKRDQEETNSFIDRLRELGKTNTRAQTAKAVGISPYFMRTLAYDHDLEFVDEIEAADEHASILASLEAGDLHKSLFRPDNSVPKSSATFMRAFMMSNTPDEL